MTNLFAKGHKNNPSEKELQETKTIKNNFAKIMAEYEAKEAEFIQKRKDLFANMTPEEKEAFLAKEMLETSKKYVGVDTF